MWVKDETGLKTIKILLANGPYNNKLAETTKMLEATEMHRLQMYEKTKKYETVICACL